MEHTTYYEAQAILDRIQNDPQGTVIDVPGIRESIEQFVNWIRTNRGISLEESRDLVVIHGFTNILSE